ncbi:histidine kinase [Shewanella sp. D64]|uniref:histidine kinase n=1 Tax=unclassified Shewanella TaxID=196818 RepID=UPI0022BA3E3B|nr:MULTISPECIES: histidine kinase [unclassified Shewanella]MEC4726769.1 histidine kinase [Shewanella sp. D64]MEC4739119.1 histidine kinase [Shewanella sp. E94]WBJ95975.1 histidine kinase [Shewanella sp. MTB7]
MDFRLIVLCLSFWFTPAWANTMDRLDSINTLLYEYPSRALEEINSLDHISSPIKLSEAEKLRLSLLRCETYLQLGENQAAINIARMSEAKAKILNIKEARPYFLNCMAGAFTQFGDYRQALPLLDTSIELSRKYKQPQSLINGLRIRGVIDTHIDSYGNAFEDLRLAIAIYSEISNQPFNWSWPPQAYIHLSLSKLLAQGGEFKQAYEIIESALASEPLQGKVKAMVLSQVTYMALLTHLPSSDTLILKTKNQLPQLGTAFELAQSYTQMAQLEFIRGNLRRAIQLLDISLNTFKKENKSLEVIRTQRQLAEVLLAHDVTDKGLTLMQQTIDMAKRKSRYDELVLCYQILSLHYENIGNFKLAYEYQVYRFNAAENSFDFIKDTRLRQLNAKLSQQNQLLKFESSESIVSASQSFSFQSGYIVVFILLFFTLLLSFLIYRSKQQTKQIFTAPETNSKEQKIEHLLSNSKLSGFPLSLILINTLQVYRDDLPILNEQLAKLLREQDLMFNKSDEEIILLLPYTKEEGALKVIEQIKELMLPLLRGNISKIGYSKLQQHDNISSLIKRANVQQLRQRKKEKLIHVR